MSDAPGPLVQALPLVFLFVIFYFLLIRPQQKRQKEMASMLAKLDKNDEVVTAGGVHATVRFARARTSARFESPRYSFESVNQVSPCATR